MVVTMPTTKIPEKLKDDAVRWPYSLHHPTLLPFEAPPLRTGSSRTAATVHCWCWFPRGSFWREGQEVTRVADRSRCIYRPIIWRCIR
jgi:hypothetical protein